MVMSKEEKRAKRREYQQRPEVKERRRNGDLKKIYGITIEEYNKLLKKQGGVCVICRNKEVSKRNGKIIDLAVDHNHKTGKVRGLICNNCNNTLGYSQEDISRLLKCVRYLR